MKFTQAFKSKYLDLWQKVKTNHQKEKVSSNEIIDPLSGESHLRSKRELIEKFISENLPRIDNADDIPEAFEKPTIHPMINMTAIR